MRHRLAGIILHLLLLPAACLTTALGAGWTVVDAGSTRTFDAAAGALTTTWQLNGRTVSTSANFTWAPAVDSVGTHWLRCVQSFPDGTKSTIEWGLRARIPVPVSPTIYYVSPSGSDSNAGTLAAPFLTLEKARDQIRTLPRPLAAGGVTVFLRGGTYLRTGTFALTTLDSGTSGAPVIYSAYPGENVVLTTGNSIPSASFTPLAASEQGRVAPGVDPARIWETDASGFTNKGPYPKLYETWPVRNALATTTSVPDVFYNGSRAWLSRYPNHNLADDYLTPNLRMNGIATDVTGTAYLNTNGTYQNSSGAQVSVGGAFQYQPADADHVARWQTALSRGGVWLQGYWRVTWQSSIAKVLGIDTTNQVIQFEPGSAPNGGFGNKYAAAPAGYTGRPGNKAEPYWVMNLLEEMDQPGEWCVDFSRNKLYFLMDQPGAPPDGSVVVADNIGALVQMTGTSNTIFQSLTFARSLGVGIDMKSGCLQNLVLGCSFRGMTNMAVSIGNNSNNNGVVSCNLDEMGAMGIQIGPGTTGAFNSGNFVVNTKMTGLSRYAQVYQPGINVTENSSTTQPSVKLATNILNRIAHNHIHDTPQMGVQFDGEQGTYEFNDISKYGTLVDDTGSFYSYEDQAGDDTFRYNYSHDTVLANAITYDGVNRVVSGHFYGNLSQLDAACEGQSIGIGTHSQIDCVNNMSIGGGRYGSFIFKSTLQSNINNNAAVAGFYPTKDYVWDPGPEVLANGPNLSYATDPGFINMNGKDLRLRPDARILTDLPDFTPIPFEMIGLYNDEYRTDGVVHPPHVTTSGGTFTGGGTEALLNGMLVYPQFDVNASVSVYYGNTDGGTNTAAWANVVNLGTLGAGPFVAHVTGVLSNQPVFYRVLATNSAGQSWSETTSAAYPSVPDVPTGLTASPGYAQNSIAWNAASYAAAYDIQRATAPGGPYVTIATGVVGTSYTDIGLITGTTYYYTVKATNATGSSAATASASGVPVPGTAVKADNATPLDQGPSWTIGATPTPLDKALWNGIYSSGTASIGGGLAVNQLQLASPSRAITISPGTGDLTIGPGGIDMSAATQNLTIGSPVVLAGAQAWNVASGRTLTVNGSIDDQGFGFSAAGYGTVVLTAGNTITGSVSVAAPAGGLPTYKFGGNNPSGYLKLSGGTVGPLTANGRLDIQNGAVAGTISGSGNSGLIYQTSTTAPELAFQAGSGFSMFQIGADNATATLRQTGIGAVSFTFFGYNTASASARTTFDGGTWNLGQIGQNNTGAQTSGTVDIIGSAGVNITSGGFAHGRWNVSNGTLQFGGNVSEGNGSSVPGNTSLVLNLTGTGSSLLVNGSLTLGDGGSGTNTNALSISGGTARMTNLTIGTTTAGHADTNTATLSGGKLIASGTFASAVSGTLSTCKITTTTGSTAATIPSGSGQRTDLVPGLVISGNPAVPDGTTIASISGSIITLSAAATADGIAVPTTFTGGSQTNPFNWTGGQLTAATISCNAGFSGSIASNTLIQQAGTLAPGDSGTAGKTVISGNYQLGAAGTLAMDVGGTIQATAFQTGQYDLLTVSGTTVLAGNLSVKLAGGFVPANPSSYTILSSTGVLSGNFANAPFGSRLTTAGGEGSFLLTRSGNSILLSDYQSSLTLVQAWRLLWFGTSSNTGTAADTFDADGDGLVNLLEYALGSDPTSAASATPTVSGSTAGHLTLSFNRIADPALVYQVEASGDFSNTPWSPIWQSTGAENTAGPVMITDSSHTINVSVPPLRFLRLRVTNP